MPGADVTSRIGKLELMPEFGATRVNIVSLDPDISRTFDQYGVAAEMAAGLGMEMVTEFAPALSIRNLAMARDAARHVGRSDFRLLIDAMHFYRSGGTSADLAAIGPDEIGYVQLCDAPNIPSTADYITEATQERLAPDDGDLPLHDFLSAIPQTVLIGLEIPQVSRHLSGVGPRERIGHAVESARAVARAA